MTLAKWAVTVAVGGTLALCALPGPAAARPAPVPLDAWPGCPPDNPSGPCRWCPGDPPVQTGNHVTNPVVWDDTITGAGDSPTTNRYDLTVLRGRKSTAATAFAAATTEVWLIPASLLNFFTANIFDQVRANRLLGLLPATMQFRFCPFTFASSLALADAASHAFQFPLMSASVPSLTLSLPASFNQALTDASLPIKMKVKGNWKTLDNSLVSIQVLARLATDTADRTVVAQNFAPTGSKDFATVVQFDKAGSWTVKLIAIDSTGIVVERDIAVAVTSAGGVKCAMPQMFDVNGLEVLDATGDAVKKQGVWQVTPKTFASYGALLLSCTTPGSAIYYISTGAYISNGIIGGKLASFQFSIGGNQPFLMPAAGSLNGGNITLPPSIITVTAWATAPGYAQSDNIAFNLLIAYP